MNSRANLPVLLKKDESGLFVAECLLVPDCRCTGRTRAEVLHTMQTLLRTKGATASGPYEVVHLAVTA